jgi:hypothetical protein
MIMALAIVTALAIVVALLTARQCEDVWVVTLCGYDNTDMLGTYRDRASAIAAVERMVDDHDLLRLESWSWREWRKDAVVYECTKINVGLAGYTGIGVERVALDPETVAWPTDSWGPYLRQPEPAPKPGDILISTMSVGPTWSTNPVEIPTMTPDAVVKKP